MTRPKWLRKDTIIAVHQKTLREQGGRPGIRDEGLLESALARPLHVYESKDDPSLFLLAAAYGFGISSNHTFIDGNKRVAFYASVGFLRINGIYIDAAEAYLRMPEEVKEVLRSIPAAWDDTKFLAGYPGQFVVMARKSGHDWFIGGINGETSERKVSIDLSFLAVDGYELLLLGDGNNRETFSVLRQPLNQDGVMNITMAPRGGFLAWLEK